MNVALIEFNPFHDECLYSQVKFINSNQANRVFLIYNRNLKGRINYWSTLEASLSISSNQWGLGYWRIYNFLKKNKIEYLVCNSLHTPQVYRLLKLIRPLDIRVFGVVHDVQELVTKKQRVIDKNVEGYFVLNDFLSARAKAKVSQPLKLASFYPIFFPALPTVTLNKPAEEIWISIPGLMEPWRRDYQRLIESLSKQSLAGHIRLFFLGKSTDKKGHKLAIREALEGLDKHGQMMFWDDFIDQPVFHTYLQATDYLLPLLHAKSGAAKRYQDKITGLYNLGFAYGKRFVMEDFLSEIDDFKSGAYFYGPDDDLVSVLNNLGKPPGASPYTDSKFTLEYQSKAYLSFLSGTQD